MTTFLLILFTSLTVFGFSICVASLLGKIKKLKESVSDLRTEIREKNKKIREYDTELNGTFYSVGVNYAGTYIKASPIGYAPKEGLRGELRHLKYANNKLHDALDEAIKLGRKYEKIAKAKPQPSNLDPEFIKKLIRLTHPDKHGNSNLANDVTATLNGMKT